MEQLKNMKETLTSIVQAQMADLANVDTKELGEAVDMIKDLSEAVYYCTVVEAMEKGEKEEKYYSRYLPYEKSYQYNPYRDMDIDNGKMYYSGNGGNNSNYYTPVMRDAREGSSPQMRKNYIESKELHHDKAYQMKELEKYMKELSKDITEMIEGATPEEKQLLK